MQLRLVSLAVAAAAFAGGQAAQPPQAAPAKPIRQRVAPPARIMDFKAEPETIRPGESVMLTWAAENPSGVTIDPDLGRVTARGSRQVSPAATTTYTLTVRGPANSVLTRTVTVNVAGAAAAPLSPVATAAKRDAPRMPDGKPDLSGVYNFGGGGRGGNAVSAKLKPGAEQFKVVRGPNDTGQYADCMPVGVPQAYSVPYQWEIVQGLDHIVIMYEYPHTFRVIPITNSPHQADLDPTWMGDSIGHWEGDTLVVDVVGFNDKTELPGGFHHSEALHVVERFHRADFDTLEYKATVEDPNVFEAPWTLERTFPLRGELAKVDEFVCENNHDYSKLFKQ